MGVLRAASRASPGPPPGQCGSRPAALSGSGPEPSGPEGGREGGEVGQEGLPWRRPRGSGSHRPNVRPVPGPPWASVSPPVKCMSLSPPPCRTVRGPYPLGPGPQQGDPGRGSPWGIGSPGLPGRRGQVSGPSGGTLEGPRSCLLPRGHSVRTGNLAWGLTDGRALGPPTLQPGSWEVRPVLRNEREGRALAALSSTLGSTLGGQVCGCALPAPAPPPAPWPHTVVPLRSPRQVVTTMPPCLCLCSSPAQDALPMPSCPHDKLSSLSAFLCGSVFVTPRWTHPLSVYQGRHWLPGHSQTQSQDRDRVPSTHPPREPRWGTPAW